MTDRHSVRFNKDNNYTKVVFSLLPNYLFFMLYQTNSFDKEFTFDKQIPLLITVVYFRNHLGYGGLKTCFMSLFLNLKLSSR